MRIIDNPISFNPICSKMYTVFTTQKHSRDASYSVSLFSGHLLFFWDIPQRSLINYDSSCANNYSKSEMGLLSRSVNFITLFVKTKRNEICLLRKLQC